jgi:hypothetical protein
VSTGCIDLGCRNLGVTEQQTIPAVCPRASRMRAQRARNNALFQRLRGDVGVNQPGIVEPQRRVHSGRAAMYRRDSANMAFQRGDKRVAALAVQASHAPQMDRELAHMRRAAAPY